MYRGQDVFISSLKASRVYYGLGDFAGTASCVAPPRYAPVVRILVCVPGEFARQVRNRLCANLVGLPVIKSYGFQVEVSTVVSTVLQVSGYPAPQ